MINQNKKGSTLLIKFPKSIMYVGLFFFCIFIITNCASVPPDNRFLIDNLDNTEKSTVMADKGISLYKIHLEKEENYRMLGEVKEYFEVALRFDPDNTKARDYLGKIENFVTKKIEEKIDLAKKLLKKKKRSAEDDYNLVLAVNEAYELDPKNEEILALKKDTDTLGEELIPGYIELLNVDLEKITEKDTPVQKSKKYVAALAYCRKALQLDPDNKQALSEEHGIIAELDIIMKDVLGSARGLLTKKDYKGAASLLKTCVAIDKNIGGKFKKDTESLTYDLNYAWAQDYLAKKDYKNALGKIEVAIRAKSTKDALKLKKKITSVKQKQDAEKKQKDSMKSREASLKEIDVLIDNMNYGEAYDKIQSLLGKARDKKYIKQLKDKENEIKGLLGGLYDTALNAYKQKQYKEAIKLLTIIVHIDKKYKQAEDYLDKAISGQELLDSY